MNVNLYDISFHIFYKFQRMYVVEYIWDWLMQVIFILEKEKKNAPLTFLILIFIQGEMWVI